jgi:leader peptidase (prepilin peptidase)/N-methyltransferase
VTTALTATFLPILIVALALSAWLLIRIPRTLFTEAGETAPGARREWGLIAILALAGVAAFTASGGHSPSSRLAFALAAMIFAAVVYADFSFMVIPDLYSAGLVLLALLAPWKLAIGDAVLGAALCGGLMAGMAFIWRAMKGADGLGFGDVKLAAALGALLGGQQGLLAISLSAALTAVLAWGWQKWRTRRDLSAGRDPVDEAPLIPYGAAMALAGIGFLARSLI